ncbi:MAG: DUF1127 domain-containing protein [Rhodospirillales bacterium]|nr:DUF1127 domain-containing protein [Rhodospirillales bacterium]
MFESLKARFRDWMVYYRTVNALSALDQHELDDLGIATWKIPEIARQAARHPGTGLKV